MLQGAQSWVFANRPILTASAAVVGPDEGKGPLGRTFDVVHDDMRMGQDSWEKAERALMEEAAQMTITQSKLEKSDIQFYLGGDLMNQIISSSFAARTLAIPHIGLFGACSTSMASLALSAQLVDSGAARHVLTGTCSHNCTAEKQFRYPTEYGAQKPPTAQYTVTGAGAGMVSASGTGPVVAAATIGKVVDMGVKDPFNMGAAMAPAAADTLKAHFQDMNRTPSDYDLIVTGDLAAIGHALVKDLMAQTPYDMNQTNFDDCGLMIYDRNEQSQVMAGGSGCGCSATVTYGHLLQKLRSGELRRIMVVATGSLLSQLTFQQGESIPCIAHAVVLESGV